MRKERFPEQRKFKLQPRGDELFQVLEKINDNAYKIDLPRKYNVSNTFLSPFIADDEALELTSSLFLKREGMMRTSKPKGMVSRNLTKPFET